ncbi:restriction endonuclease [Halomonas maura]|uniref:restriction endonuclease n=1 Tax=Halomonas maura TaxID=117606 RepID=UPI0025B4F2FC|nr:restriction endonuclease [Halomonas maura]MDN3554389.1 restriction endonuclease [Halomonas maura]
MSEFLKERALKIMDQQGINQNDIQQRVDIIAYGFENSGLWFGIPFISECEVGEPLIALLMEYDEYQLSVMALLSAALHASAEPTIDLHLQTLNNKKNRLIYIDEYGDLIQERWERELNKYYKEKLEAAVMQHFNSNAARFRKTFGLKESSLDYHWILAKSQIPELAVNSIQLYIALKSEPKDDGTPKEIIEKNNGIEYEHHLIGIINSTTKWMAEGTTSSGDQGADIIIQKSGFTGVVQVKDHNTKVGNKAVQEAYAAKKHYKADMAFVVSKAGYTNSAWELSESTGVKILSEHDFIEFLS